MTPNPAVEIHGPERTSAWLVTCDHASNQIPDWIGGASLGLSDAEMGRHIAFDLGAAGVSRALADHLQAPAVLSRFSRLVIDPNRGEDDPTLIMRLYDGTIVPGNRAYTAEDKTRRLAACYRPYHEALAQAAAKQDDTIIVAVHSFTPRLFSWGPRPWHIGILSAQDRRLSDPLIDLLNAEGDLCVGDNEPYAGHLPGDAIDRHALKPGRPNTLIEIRHDLIETPAQQAEWAARLAPLLIKAASVAGL